MSETGTAGSGLVVVDRRHSAPITEHDRAFPRNPAGPANTAGPDGTVAPAAPTGAVLEPDPSFTGSEPPTSPPVPTTQPWAGWPADWAPPVPWTPQLSRRVSTVFSCVRVNSEAIGSMTPVLEAGRYPIARGDFRWRSWLLNPQPELYADWSEFAQALDVSLELRGNAYVAPTSRYADGYPRTFHVMDPDTVKPVHVDGVKVLLDNHGAELPADVLHLRYLVIPGQAAGIGPVEGAAGNLEAAAAGEAYGRNLTAGGAVPWGVLEPPERLRPGQAQLARAEYLAGRRDLSGAPAILPAGWTLKPLTLSPKDMALLDLRVFDEQRICGAFGVPPSMVALPQPEGMTYANIVDRRAEHYVTRLRPSANRTANALANWALPGAVGLRLNASEYVQGSVKERVETWLPLFSAGVVTAEELRELVGLPPGANLDALAQMTSGTQ